MAIGTYTELQAAVAGRMNRGDLGSAVTEGIAACVGRLNRDLRHPEMVTVNTSFAASARLTSLPTDYLQMESPPILNYNGVQELEFISGALDARIDDRRTSGIPKRYSIRGTKIELSPTPSGAFTLELSYFGAITQFSNGSDTNWLLTKYPDVYLYGSLVHTALLMMDDQRLNYYKPIFEEALSEVAVAGKYARFGPAMRVRAA